MKVEGLKLLKIGNYIINPKSIISISLYEKEFMVENYYLEIKTTELDIIRTFKTKQQLKEVAERINEYLVENDLLEDLIKGGIKNEN